MPQKINEPAQRVDAQSASHTAGPFRQCCVTRESLPAAQLVRFVRSPDGKVVPDIAGKLPGRGAWLKARRDYLDTALKTGAFSRAFKAPSACEGSMASLLEQQLAARCIGLIGMAKKSGLAVTGFDQARGFIRKQAPGWILTAADSAEDGRRKVHFLAKALYDDVNIAGALTSAELGMAFGHRHVIHAVLTEGRLAESFTIAYTRLTGFRLRPEIDWFSGEPQSTKAAIHQATHKKG